MRETLRAWTENLETFFREVIFEERRGLREELVRALLYAGSKVFEIAVKTRRFLYNVRILRDSTLGVQVIAIGNLTVGGTGKTPVVEKFARELQDQGRNVAILSRGYRSKPPPLHAAAAEQAPAPRGHHPAARGLGRQIAAARFRDGRRRALHAGLQPQGRGGAGGQGPRQERPLRHREVRLRHAAAGRRVPVLEAARAAGRTSC